MRIASLSSSLSSSLASLALSLVASAGCLAEDGGALGEPDPALDDVALSQTESALCAPTGTPPSPDWTHNFATDPNQIRSITSYGTNNCANYVVRLLNGGSPTYEQGTIDVYLTGAVPTTPESCVGTSLTVREWSPPAGTSGWTQETTTTNGEWTATGCNFPRTFRGYSYWTSGVRYEISAQRFYCPNGGPLCAAQYGLPVKIKVIEG